MILILFSIFVFIWKIFVSIFICFAFFYLLFAGVLLSWSVWKSIEWNYLKGEKRANIHGYKKKREKAWELKSIRRSKTTNWQFKCHFKIQKEKEKYENNAEWNQCVPIFGKIFFNNKNFSRFINVLYCARLCVLCYFIYYSIWFYLSVFIHICDVIIQRIECVSVKEIENKCLNGAHAAVDLEQFKQTKAFCRFAKFIHVHVYSKWNAIQWTA